MNEYKKIEDIKISKNIGSYFRKIRKAKKISVDKVSKDLCIGRTSINNYETGDRKISLGMFIKLVNYYDLNLNDVFINFSEYFENNYIEKKEMHKNEYLIASDISNLISYIVSNKFNHDELVHLNNYAKFIMNERNDT